MRTTLFLFLLTLTASAFAVEAPTQVKEPTTGKDGIINYPVISPYQAGENAVEVLLPDNLDPAKRYPVIYFLPVNDGIDGPWGSGIQEAKRFNLHNRHQVICVSPEYNYTPWFGDHPTEPTLRQESHLIHSVIPMIEERYPVIKGKDGRMLLGFSKSGFGAITILLRNLDVIGKAVSWDSPLTSTAIFKGEEEMVRVFETDENFAHYSIPGLIDKQAKVLAVGPPRIYLISSGPRPTGSAKILHDKLTGLGIAHGFKVDKARQHTWTSEWVPVAVDVLFESETKKD